MQLTFHREYAVSIFGIEKKNNSEDVGMYLRNVSNAAHINTTKSESALTLHHF
jgi:hypothetical protein